MRNFCAALVATSLMIVPMASAQTLTPGKPAGVQAAQRMDNTVLIVVGVAVAAAGIALAVSAGGNGPSSNTTQPIVTPTTA